MTDETPPPMPRPGPDAPVPLGPPDAEGHPPPPPLVRPPVPAHRAGRPRVSRLRRSFPTYRAVPGLVRAVTILLTLYAAIGLLGAAFGWSEIQLIQDWQDGVEITDERAEANDNRVSTVGTVQFGILIITYFVFGAWLMRANRNARALSTRALRYTPGWTVGWYFIPFANWWKPYDAVREVWLQSTAGGMRAFRAERSPVILRLWWGLWLASSFAGNAAFRLNLHAETADDWMMASRVTFASDLLDIPLCAMAILLVRGITKTQEGGNVAQVYE